MVRTTGGVGLHQMNRRYEAAAGPDAFADLREEGPVQIEESAIKS